MMPPTYTTAEYERAKGEVLLVGYEARWGGDADRYEVLGVEESFFTALVNPATGAASKTWRLGGKLDVRVRERFDGRRVLVVEHKTTSEEFGAGSDYLKRLRLDGQVSIYFVGGTSRGFEIEGCLYDVIGKPGQKPSQVPLCDADGVPIVLDANGERVRTRDGKRWRTTGDKASGYTLQTRPETPAEYGDRIADAIAVKPDEFYARTDVARLDGEVDDALADIWSIGRQLREAELAGRYPRNPDACVRYGRTCEYFPVCTGEASLDDPSLFQIAEALHPELGAIGDDPIARTHLLTSSRLKDARACQRLHRYKYGQGYRTTRESEALRFGSLVHLGLEAWWRAVGRGATRPEHRSERLASVRYALANGHMPEGLRTHFVGDECPGSHLVESSLATLAYPENRAALEAHNERAALDAA